MLIRLGATFANPPVLSRSQVPTIALLALFLVSVGSANACEKHLKGHQNSSDSQAQASER
jgi:hypothetical protein